MNAFLKWAFDLPRPSTIATFHMRSGDRVTIRCSNIKIKSTANTLTEYVIDGMDERNKVLYIRVEDISAISFKKSFF